MQRDPNETAMPIIAAELSQAQTFAIAASAFDAGSLYGDGMNLFQFAGSNPITGRDPLGLESYGSLMTASFGRALLFSISNIAVGAGFGALGGAGSAWYNNQNITDGALHGAQIGAVFGAGFSAGALTTAYAASASGLFGTATVGTSYAIGGVGGATGGMAAGEYADPNGDSGGHIADAMFAMVDSVATEGLLNVLGGWKPDSSPLLGTRVREIHGALDDIAQRQRTTAILETSNGTRIIAGGGRDLTPAQRALLAPGEVVAKLPGEHAEITALQYAKQNGLVPSEIAVSRNICPECVAAIEAAGGQMTSGTTASFP